MLSRKAKLIKRTSGLSKGTLLDIGTGTGYFSNKMKERGWRVTAIEKSPQARAFAKEHFELDVDTEDALAGYAEHSFDAITLWHVMEHLEHLNETWEKLFKLLKERGVLIVAEMCIRDRDLCLRRTNGVLMNIMVIFVSFRLIYIIRIS